MKHITNVDDLYEAIYLIRYNISNPLCPICEKPIPYIGGSKGYYEFCSNTCRKTDKGVMLSNEVRKKTNKNIDGVEHTLQNKEVMDKLKQTNIEKYGYENVLECPAIQDKIKQTNLMKYGCK